MAVCAAVACPLFVSCESFKYDDTAIKEQLEAIINRVYELEQKMNSEIQALKDLLEGSLLIESALTDASTGITTIKLSNGAELQLLPEKDLKSFVTYLTSAGVDYWAYIDADGKKQYFLDENGEAIPVLPEEMPTVITRDDEAYLVIGGVEYPMGGNSIFSGYELIADELTGEVYAVTFTFGENMSFTVTIDGAAGFMFVKNEGWSQIAVSDYFIPLGKTTRVAVQAYGVVDYVLQIPDGWRIKDGQDALVGTYFDITAPSRELVESGVAAADGDLKVVAVLQGGKAMVAKLQLKSDPFKTFAVSFGNATIVKNNGLEKYVYGICKAADFDEAAAYAKAIELLDLYEYPAGYGVTFDDIVEKPLAELAGEELVPGTKYMFWAIPALYSEEGDGSYYLEEGSFVKETVGYDAVTFNISDVKTLDAKLDLTFEGVSSYYFELVPKSYFYMEDVLRMLNTPGGCVAKTEPLTHSGSIFTFAEVEAEPATEYVAWVAVAEEGKEYKASDVLVREFTTLDLQPGSAVKVAVGTETATSADVVVNLSAQEGKTIRYAFLTAAEARKYADDAARVKYLLENGAVADASGVEVSASAFCGSLAPGTDLVLMALVTDAEGKYSEVLYKEYKTTAVQYNEIEIAAEVILNTPEEVKLKLTVTGGEAAEYLYWIGGVKNNFWTSSSYLGGSAEKAQAYMSANPEDSRFSEAAAKYPLNDGVISMTGHTPGAKQVLIIMAKDAAGLYSKAAELRFTPHAVNIGNVVLKTDPKWKNVEPTIDWIEESFSPAVGMMSGSYAFYLTVQKDFTAYVMTGNESYFELSSSDTAKEAAEQKILAIIDAADSMREYDTVFDNDLFRDQGYPYGHEFYHREHGAPKYGYGVLWASKEYHDKVCGCEEKEVEKLYTGVTPPIPYIQKHVIDINEGKPVLFEKGDAIGSKDKVEDRVYVVLQDLEGNCYEVFEWDVPIELFANAKPQE